MKSTGFMVLATSIIAMPVSGAEARPTLPQAGEVYELVKSYETESRTNGGSSGSSRGRDGMVERIIAVSDVGIEVEYDLSKDVPDQDRLKYWQFPARIFRSPDGAIQLLNRDELERRVDLWLKAAGWTREACGRTIFTWNVFRIECDPQSVVEAIRAVDLTTPDIREGEPYHDAMARAPAVLARKGEILVAEFAVDPDAVRRARAESDVVVGEVLGKPVLLEEALAKRSQDRISGTISISFDTDPVGNIWRRIKETRMTTTGPDGETNEEMAKEVVERRLVH